MLGLSALLVCLVAAPPPAAMADSSVIAQDFNEPFEVGRWPEDARLEFSSEWAPDGPGTKSLKIYDGTMASIADLDIRDWSAFDVCRLHVFVPGDKGCALGVEIQDNHTTYYNRHQNNASAPPGESEVDVDISGDLWRGEVGRPYRDVKTPINKDRITRFSLTARGATLFVNRIELIKLKRLAVPGGWAFDFGGPATPVQAQWTGIFPDTAWDESRKFGFAGTPRFFPKTTPHPTPVMGDGLMFEDAEFSVVLDGGNYRGWAVFDRSGFWEGEQALYEKLNILVNGRRAYSRKDDPAAPYFALQNTEVLNQDDLVRMVLQRQGEGIFKFKAAAGRNRFRIELAGLRGEPPRLAGLVLAPDTAEGRAFIEAHRAAQRKVIADTHRIIAGTAARKDNATGPALVAVPLPSGHVMRPGEEPQTAEEKEIPAITGFAGTTAFRLLGIYASGKIGEIRPSLGKFTGPGEELQTGALSLWVNRYLPMRDYETTACQIESHHYRPAGEFTAGAGLARSLLVMARIPADAKPGEYSGLLTLDSKVAGRKQTPLRIRILPGALPRLDFPVGLYFSGVPVPRQLLKEKEYWSLNEKLLDLQEAAGRTMLTGGPSYRVEWKDGKAEYKGEDCIRLIGMARKRGMALAVSGYGGFSLGLGPRGFATRPGMEDAEVVREMGRAWRLFCVEHELPVHYAYSYDEPGTPEDFAPVERLLKMYRKAGFKTMGYTSMHDPKSADENHVMLARETYAPAFNLHSPEVLAFVRELGNEPWVYNNGLGRYQQGIHLWRNRRAGAAGRLDWIGAIVQGWQFDALDSREPDPSCFFFHSRLGVLFAPRFLDMCEGAFEARLLAELERRASRNPGSALADEIGALFKELESLPYRRALSESELDSYRARMLELFSR